MDGWILLHRKFLSNFLWTENRTFSKAEAWIDILFQVRFLEEQDKVMIKNALITCDRGQSLNSLDTWATRWNWTKSATRRFLHLLKGDKMILIENVKKTTRLTVCNYETYQLPRIAVETQVKRKRNAGETQVKPEERKVKNETNENNDKKKNYVTETSGFSQKSSISFASDELKFYDVTLRLFHAITKSDKTSLRNIAKFLRTQATKGYPEIFDQAWKFAQTSKKDGDKPMALFMSIMKKEFGYRKIAK